MFLCGGCFCDREGRAAMNNNILKYYKDHVQACFFSEDVPSVSRFFHGHRFRINQQIGKGGTEILRIHNGLHVALADYCLKRQLDLFHREVKCPLSLHLVLSGGYYFQLPGQETQHIAAGDVWCMGGTFERVMSSQLPDVSVRCLAIYLPGHLVSCCLDGSSCAVSKKLEKLAAGCSGGVLPGQQMFPVARGLHASSEIMSLVRHLLFSGRQTFVETLRFESLALDLLSRVLMLEKPRTGHSGERIRKIKATVDETVDILRREWNDPPNISNLARRVGVNESYLKEWFREHIGMTIGVYIREQRMKKARQMIETGRHSILQTALFVGYSNPSHFSAAFKKFYGRLPSYYLPHQNKIS